jgi:putative hemolysin
MPSDPAHAEQTQAEVLSRMAEFSVLPGMAEKLFPVEKVRELYRRVRQCPEGFRLDNLLAEMRVELRVDAADAVRIPASGPVVVVANHPFGMLDGAVLTVLLARARPDVKVMTNFLLSDVPELQRHCIFVNAWPNEGSAESNRRALREALAWLQSGGMLAIFPAGDVSHLQFPAAQITDSEWNDTAVRLIRRSGASALPMYFRGHNSVGFQLMGMIHPRMIDARLRTAFLLQEFLQQEGKPVEVRVGSEISAESIAGIGDDREATDYLRWRTYLLGRRTKAETSWPAAGGSRVSSRSKLSLRSKLALHSKLAFKAQKPVASPIESPFLQQELDALPADRCLAQNSEFGVYLALAKETPRLLQEVGRLREVTFRWAGEGTGNSRDLDRFDRYYWHMLLWHKTRRELAGAYRAGNTAEILAQHGISGLYTSTLFDYDARLFEKLGPALELGRSFIRAEYQRQYAPLLLLWKAIARLVARNPLARDAGAKNPLTRTPVAKNSEIPVLFGAVSISNDYNAASREMIYRFFESRMQDDELAGLVKPRSPFRPARLRPWDCRAMCAALRDLEELSQPITDVEADGKGLPILLRQYAKIGGKLLGFNVDRKFSNVLDGLIVVDLRQTEPAVLERYMGREDAAKFRQVHGI